jgi:hypothetical protein
VSIPGIRHCFLGQKEPILAIFFLIQSTFPDHPFSLFPAFVRIFLSVQSFGVRYLPGLGLRTEFPLAFSLSSQIPFVAFLSGDCLDS